MEIKVKNNQSVVDIAMQETGTVEGLWDVLKLNSRTDLELDQGTVLKSPLVIQSHVVDFFKRDNAKPITSATMGVTLSQASAVNVKAKNSSGEVISMKTVTNTDNAIAIPNTFRTLNGQEFLEAPSGTSGDILLVDENGDEVVPASVSSAEIVIPKQSGWQRPSKWLKLPDPNVNEAYFLFAVFENAPNQIAFTFTTNVNQKVEIYDGVNTAPIATYTSGFNNITVDWNACHPSTFFSERHYRQCIIKLSATTFYQLNLVTSHATYGSGKMINILDGIIHCPSLQTPFTHSFGASAQLPYMLEQMVYKSLPPVNVPQWFWNASSLKSLILPSDFTVTLIMRESFKNCGLDYLPPQLKFRTSNMYDAFGQSSVKIVKADMSVNGGGQILFNQAKIQEIWLTNCGAATTAISSFALPSLQKLILEGYKLTTNISNSLLVNEQAQLNLVNSLADLTGSTSQSIIMTGLPIYASVTTLANSKNWTITY